MPEVNELSFIELELILASRNSYPIMPLVDKLQVLHFQGVQESIDGKLTAKASQKARY